MQLHFKATNYELTAEMEAFATKKLNALSKFVGKETDSQVHLYVELGRETGAHSHGRVWRAELNMDKDGDRFRAEATQESLEDAIDATVRELSQSLRSHKSKRESLGKRGGRMLKSMLRGFKD